MCTVTLIARRNGYALGMNRDEQRTRVPGRPPTRARVGSVAVLCPTEPGGGTWIGVNEAGVTLALVNWYSVAARAPRPAASRGAITKASLAASSPAGLENILAGAPLSRVHPFRLIGIFPADRQVVEWRWNLQRLERIDHPWQTATWISSGFDEAGAQRTRGQVFQAALAQSSAGGVDWLRRLHRSHRPGCGPYSTCMHREDAVTVSYTEVVVTAREARMWYVAGAPCGREGDGGPAREGVLAVRGRD